MAVAGWLIDTSAYVRVPSAADAPTWLARAERGLVHISTLTRLEIGYSYRNGGEAREDIATSPQSLMPVEYLTPAMESRAMEVQLLLADRGRHRAPSIPDLLIAATAELAGLTVLAVDKDFELIAEITGQRVETLRL
jgi:predicted nucleic acid-binding protein